MTMIVVGLGPGDPSLLTVEADRLLRSAEVIYARTGRHPVCESLREAGVRLETFDDVYETSATLDDVYAEIVRRLVALDSAGAGDVIYALPGHPCLGETTTQSVSYTHLTLPTIYSV